MRSMNTMAHSSTDNVHTMYAMGYVNRHEIYIWCLSDCDKSVVQMLSLWENLENYQISSSDCFVLPLNQFMNT